MYYRVLRTLKNYLLVSSNISVVVCVDVCINMYKSLQLYIFDVHAQTLQIVPGNNNPNFSRNEVVQKVDDLQEPPNVWLDSLRDE